MGNNRTAILALLLLVFPLVGFSQRYELGFYAGGTGYTGDLAPRNLQKYTDLAFGALFRWNINPRNTLKFSFTHGTARADDAWSDDEWQQNRNLHFKSHINEFSVQFEFNFLRYNPLWGDENIAPYLSTGVSIFNYDPKARDANGEWTFLQPLGTEGQGEPGYSDTYKKVDMAIPLALGLKYNIGSNWNLFTEMGYRFSFTDYLDDVSGKYPDAGDADPVFTDRRLDNTIASPGLQRGDLLKNDTYIFAVVGISYTFVSSWCPSFSAWGKE